MLRLTLKNLAANRLRFALTTFAVILAVSFVVSSFVLTDGLRDSFNKLSGEIVAGTDFDIRPVDEFGQSEPLPTSLLQEVAAVDGVASAAPVVEVENSVLPINAEGEEIPTAGPPQLAFGWIDDPTLTSFTLVEGEAPDQPGEFTMDLDAAANHGFSVGETYDVITPRGQIEATLTGLVSFGENNDTLGATLMQFDLEALQEMVGTDGYDSILIAVEGGADRAQVEAELTAVASGAEVIDSATLESEQRADFNSGIDVFGNVMLGFAGISLFVSIFIIYNTFSIVLGQRTRELGLLRTVGADPVQLRRSVLAESAIIGAAASIIGIGVGVGLALGIRALFNALGAELPDSPTIVSARTMIVAAAVGIGATMVSAIGPARKASRVPPIAALRDGAAAGAASGRVRMAIGLGLLSVGALGGALGLFVASTTASVVALLASGAIAMFIGVAMISPVVAVPLTRVLGWPGRRLLGVSGRLAQDNAGRNPQRTATTAAALMIGLALVAMALVVGESVKAQFRSTLEGSVQADYLVTLEGEGDFPPTIASELDALPTTGPIASFRYDEARIGGEASGEITDVVATDLGQASELFDFGVDTGVGADPAVTDPLLISNERAEADSIEVGDTVAMDFASGVTRELEVIGIFEDDMIIDVDYLLDLTTWDEVGATQTDTWIGFSRADGITPEQAEAEFGPIADSYPLVDIASANEFIDTIEGIVDQVLTTVNVMVALAVIIALVGIANTLALSVFERTRELGLLRAVGMTRRQLRTMIRLEAALVALLGATLGVGVGILFGWATVVALPASITSTLAVPVTRIVLLVTVAGVAGLVAAWGPARRAGRLDVLDAIAQ
jgi:putative ABC transport system permease protein